MNKNWPILKTPPIVLAVFQLKFKISTDVHLSKLIANDKEIRFFYPLRHDNYHSEINIHGTPVPGIATYKAKSDTKIESYTYRSNDELKKLKIDKDSILIINECPYEGWESFKIDVQHCLTLISPQIADCLVDRISIRFINKFKFDIFEDSLEYFTNTISTEQESKYLLAKYAFRTNFQVPETEIRIIVNNALEPIDNKFDYYLDIDVLDQSQFTYDLDLIIEHFERLRTIKNDIFFDTVKQKTLDLCN